MIHFALLGASVNPTNKLQAAILNLLREHDKKLVYEKKMDFYTKLYGQLGQLCDTYPRCRHANATYSTGNEEMDGHIFITCGNWYINLHLYQIRNQ